MKSKAREMNSEDHTKDNGREDEAVGRLLQLAGEPQAVPEAVMARSRERVRGHWQKTVVTRRQTRIRAWSGAAFGMAASLAAALFLVNWLQVAAVPDLARVARISGQLSVHGKDSSSSIMGESGMTVSAGAVLNTGIQDRAALAWHNGHSIRLDHNTQLEVVNANLLSLRRGAIYIDSGATATHPNPITIQTPFGTARDIGTQFVVGSDDRGMTVRVRDGLVAVASDQIAIDPGFGTVARGYQLRLALDQDARQEKIETHGEDWDWTFEIAEDFELEGKSTADFLEWVCRENGWTLEYANLRVRQNAEKAVFHGSIEGLSAEDALVAVLGTLRLDFELSEGTLEIDERDQAD
jgi:ferric-dicitrate binding protein FerR (iron transport regulator)